MEGAIYLRLLGPVQVERDGEPVGGFRSRKALALLGYLAVQGHPIPRERLVDLLWEDKTESQGRSNLSWVLGRISALLPGCLQADRHTVHFHSPAGYWLDLHAFAELEAQEDVASLAAAIELYRGEFLEGLRLEGCAEFELWVVGERERWRQRAAGVLEELVARHSGRGEYEEGLRFGRQLLALEPWREETHRQVMRLLVRSGQRGAALAQYETCRQALAEELGLEPAEETKVLYERIRAVMVGRTGVLRVPGPPTRLIGREEELADIVKLLADPAQRLVTLVGPGGIGKTHLALEAAREIGETGMFLEGVTFVPLGAVASPDLLVSAIAEALEFSFHGPTDAREQLLSYLRSKEMLLVLDSFEHLLEGASLLADILARAPEVKLLVTSRERLSLQAEWLLEIGGLPFPADETVEGAEDYGAVELFVQSARRVRREFVASGEEMGGVVSVCRLVQGMPLGILLAAAWVGALNPADIAVEIEGDLDFLKADLRDLPERLRSMRAVFDHSWRLLGAEEREVFCRLSVFRGGFTREAAEEVTGASLRTLKVLVDKSLLQRDADGRYGMHELLRQYGAGRLGEAPGEEEATRDRHCAHYVGFLQERESRLMGRDQRQASAEIGVEIENARAAWDWAVAQGKVEEMDRSLDSLAEFHWMRAWYQEGEEIFAGAARRLGGAQEEIGSRESRMVLGKALLQQGRFCDALGLVEKSRELLQESLAIFRELGTRRETAYALLYSTLGYSWEEKKPLCLESLTIFEEVRDRKGIALCLRRLGHIALDEGEYRTAEQLFQECLTIFRELGDQQGTAVALDGLGYTAWIFGEYEVARQLSRESLALFQEIGDQWGVATALNLWAIAEAGLRKYGEAKQLLQQCLAINSGLGCLWDIAVALTNLGEIAIAIGEYEEAIQLAQESLSFYETFDERFATWYFRIMGEATCGLGDLSKARRYLRQALEMAAANRDMFDILLTVVGIAALLAAEGEKERAAELLALVNHHPASWQWTKDRAAPLLAELEAGLPADVVAQAQERGRVRDLDATVEELLVELESGDESPSSELEPAFNGLLSH